MQVYVVAIFLIKGHMKDFALVMQEKHPLKGSHFLMLIKINNYIVIIKK